MTKRDPSPGPPASRHRSSGGDRHHRHHRDHHRHSPVDAAAPLRACLSSLGLPSGLLSSVVEGKRSCDWRLFLLDNSSGMKVRDSHVGRRGGNADHGKAIIERVDGATRWEELQETVRFHCRMASRCWIPTKLWLVNAEEEKYGGGGGRFNLCMGGYEDVRSEMDAIKHMLDSAALDRSECPLAARVHSLMRAVTKEASHLKARDRHITVVLCTQGLPTDEKGNTGSAVRRDFWKEFSELLNLPVKIIVRLCTDDDRVRDMFNTLDSNSDSVDVLDDYWGEAMEIHLHNPWLTYGIGLHRLRESGLAPDFVDEIDERPLTLDQIHHLCKMLFLGKDGRADLPHPRRDLDGFFRALFRLVEKEGTQWNPVRRRPTPWIDMRKLEAIHDKEGSRRRSRPDPRRGSAHRGHPRVRRHSFSEQPRQGGTCRDPREEKPRPTSRPRSDRRGEGHAYPCGTGDAQGARRRPTGTEEDLSLPQFLRRWSHRPPDHERKLEPLQNLLVTAPRTFPPQNALVEEHEYFGKWKPFDAEAFEGEEGDELKELLKRAARKAKFFLHPDKLPKDATENQTLLFKTLWEVITESEAKTLG